MPTQYVIITNGTTQSSAFTVPGGTTKTAFGIETTSLGTGTAVFVEFASTVDPNTWTRLQRPDGSGLPFTVHSGTGRGYNVVMNPLGSTARLVLGAAQSSVCSFAIIPIARG